MFDKSGLRCSVRCLEVSGMGGLSLDGVGNEVSAREWTEASGVTRGQRGVNGASIECEGSEWALGDGSCVEERAGQEMWLGRRRRPHCGVLNQGDFEQRHGLS